MAERLTKMEWVSEGRRTLAAAGPVGLKVGPMADRLGVSRGSFYWHFQDIGDFKHQVLRSWADGTTHDVRAGLEAQDAEPDRLLHLIERVFGARRTLDRAIRSWATEDEAVGQVVAEVDRLRRAYIQELLEAAGLGADVARSRAALLYWALLGQAFVMDGGQRDVRLETMQAIADLMVS